MMAFLATDPSAALKLADYNNNNNTNNNNNNDDDKY